MLICKHSGECCVEYEYNKCIPDSRWKKNIWRGKLREKSSFYLPVFNSHRTGVDWNAFGVYFSIFFIIIVHDYWWLALATATYSGICFVCYFQRNNFAIDYLGKRKKRGHENWFQSQEMDFSSYFLIFSEISQWILKFYITFSVCS